MLDTREVTLRVMANIFVQFPLVHVSLPLHHVQLPQQPLAVVGQGSVVSLQVLSLNESLGAAILSIATVLECSPLLLQLDHIFSWEAMKSFVKLSDTQSDQLK